MLSQSSQVADAAHGIHMPADWMRLDLLSMKINVCRDIADIQRRIHLENEPTQKHSHKVSNVKINVSEVGQLYRNSDTECGRCIMASVVKHYQHPLRNYDWMTHAWSLIAAPHKT
jgi:hypothetical protein